MVAEAEDVCGQKRDVLDVAPDGCAEEDGPRTTAGWELGSRVIMSAREARMDWASSFATLKSRRKVNSCFFSSQRDGQRARSAESKQRRKV